MCAIVSLKFNCICIETDVLHSETSPYAAQTPTRIATAQFVGCEHGRRNLQGFAIQVVTWQRLEIVMQHLPHLSTTGSFIAMMTMSIWGALLLVESRKQLCMKLIAYVVYEQQEKPRSKLITVLTRVFCLRRPMSKRSAVSWAVNHITTKTTTTTTTRRRRGRRRRSTTATTTTATRQKTQLQPRSQPLQLYISRKYVP